MKIGKCLTISLIAVLLSIAAAGTVSAQGTSGAVFTTDSSCSAVNLNIYGSKDDVYI